MTPTEIGYAAERIGAEAARRMAGRDPDRDDLAQEAALTVHEVMQAKPDAPVSYLHGVARMRVRRLLTQNRVWTGLEVQRSKALDPLRRTETAALDAFDREPAAPDVLGEVEWATLRPEILGAIDQLPSRERAVSKRVARLVYAGFTPSEAGQRIGVGPGSGRAAWNAAKPHLRGSLGHLRDLVA